MGDSVQIRIVQTTGGAPADPPVYLYAHDGGPHGVRWLALGLRALLGRGAECYGDPDAAELAAHVFHAMATEYGAGSARGLRIATAPYVGPTRPPLAVSVEHADRYGARVVPGRVTVKVGDAPALLAAEFVRFADESLLVENDPYEWVAGQARCLADAAAEQADSRRAAGK